MPAEGEMRAPQSELPAVTADILERLRERRPRVHCITNTVAQAFTANMLLAAGAVPSMTIARTEVGAFASRSNALLVNLGTLDTERRAASLASVDAANGANIPWVLDPVFVDRSEPRAAFAKLLLAKKPQALRLNRAEFGALSGDKADDAALARFAKAYRAVVGLTGERDIVCDADRLATISNGDEMMTRVTGLGCAASAMVAACLAVESDPWKATAAALIAIGVAGEIAAARSRGPGSFAVEIVDTLYALDRTALAAGTRVS
jgi:hydroxyethylthiazole kinase